MTKIAQFTQKRSKIQLQKSAINSVIISIELKGIEFCRLKRYRKQSGCHYLTTNI